MVRHKIVLVIDQNLLSFCEDLCYCVSCVDTWIASARSRLRLDGCNGCPDKFSSTKKRRNSSQEEWESTLKLRFRITPAVHTVVEMHHREGDPLYRSHLGNLLWKTRISCGR